LRLFENLESLARRENCGKKLRVRFSSEKNSLEIPKTRLPAISIPFLFWKILIEEQKRRNVRRKGREVIVESAFESASRCCRALFCLH